MPPGYPRWKRFYHDVIAAEVSSMTRYFDRLLQWRRLQHDPGYLLDRIDCPEKEDVEGALPDLSAERTRRTAILLNGNLNHEYDILGLLHQVKPSLARTSRLIVVLYNPFYHWIYRAAQRIGLKAGAEPTTFVRRPDLMNMARLAGYEIVRTRDLLYCPWRLLGFGSFVNWLMPMVPVLRRTGLVMMVVLRPILPERESRPSLCVVIPARNERGNVEPAIARLPQLGPPQQVIFVEGHSSDGTWEEIERVVASYEGEMTLSAAKQPGRGKNDAVRVGFNLADRDLLTILDADLTMPPELLGQFYRAWCDGAADFINGSRLVYPMEGEAMRFLNRIGNSIFASALGFILDTPVTDSLCGTKLLPKHDYERIRRWRLDFGDFDPFGDFELLFSAAQMGLGIVDVPIRYRARTYGSTNINRFRHGLMLLKMVLVGLVRVKSGRIPPRT